MKVLLFLSLSFILNGAASIAEAKNAKTLRLAESDVAEVNTAIGYSTILQFDAHPSSAVLGDQDAFKVEYVGNSLTIKPVVPNAKTNLFVFTDYERFSFRLKVGSASAVDYIVKVTRRSSGGESTPIPADVKVLPNPVTESFEPTQTPESLITRAVGKTATCPRYALTLDSVAYPQGKSWLILNFSISSLTGEEQQMDAADIQVVEKKTPLVIENLYLEALKLPRDGTPIHGTAMLKRKTPSRLAGLALLLKPSGEPRSKCSDLKITLSAQKRAKGATRGEKGKS
jgi:hypothetical protein